MARDAVTGWLMEGDPAIRWQTMRDLAGAAERTVARERRRVAREGWGAQLLARQDPGGKWAGAVYSPKWTSTTYTLLELRDCGLVPGNEQALRGCRVLLDTGFWRDGGINFYPRWARYSETCITSMVLALGAAFGLEDERLDEVERHLLGKQMGDGGRNCRATPGYGTATHGSFHTTILALEALLARGRRNRRGEEFLLAHRLFRSHRTGAIAKPEFTHFHFPPRWRYDALRGLDYFRAADAEWDARLGDALELVRARRGEDGRWLLPKGWPGKVWFEMEAAGQASRWNTLRALRVLRWAEKSGAGLRN